MNWSVCWDPMGFCNSTTDSKAIIELKLAGWQPRTAPRAERPLLPGTSSCAQTLFAGRPMRIRNSLLYLYCTFESHLPSTPKPFGMYGGDDGARTRDLCRDRAAL